jgi:hypothetical protein
MVNTTKATFYLDRELYQAFKVKAAMADRKLSELMNETLQTQLEEDRQDIQAIRKRAADPTEAYEDFLEGLKKDGLI